METENNTQVEETTESKGLGDTIAKITAATGIDKLVEEVIDEDLEYKRAISKDTVYEPSKKSVISSSVSNCLFSSNTILEFVKYPVVLYTFLSSCPSMSFWLS